MEFRTLHYFLTVAQERNITRAAEKLHMAQPPLTRQIKRLEEELGVRLFERSSRDFRLTEAGEALLPQAQSLLAAAEKIKDGMKNARPAN